MGKLWEKVCGECSNIDMENITSWGHPCSKVLERKKEFSAQSENMEGVDRFRHSPDTWVRPLWKACDFFEKNKTITLE